MFIPQLDNNEEKTVSVSNMIIHTHTHIWILMCLPFLVSFSEPFAAFPPDLIGKSFHLRVWTLYCRSKISFSFSFRTELFCHDEKHWSWICSWICSCTNRWASLTFRHLFGMEWVNIRLAGTSPNLVQRYFYASRKDYISAREFISTSWASRR